MKLEIGIPEYPYDRPILNATLRGRLPHKPVPLYVVTIEEMEGLHERLPEMRGCPSYVAYDSAKKRVWLHPLPNGEYHLDIIPDFEMDKNPPVEIVEVTNHLPPAPPPSAKQVPLAQGAPVGEKQKPGIISKAVAAAFGKKV